MDCRSFDNWSPGAPSARTYTSESHNSGSPVSSVTPTLRRTVRR